MGGKSTLHMFCLLTTLTHDLHQATGEMPLVGYLTPDVAHGGKMDAGEGLT